MSTWGQNWVSIMCGNHKTNLVCNVSRTLKSVDVVSVQTHVEERVGWETTCWGCGLRVVLPKLSPMFKCGWCGAISVHKSETKVVSRWNRRCSVARDRFFVCFVLFVIFSIVCGGVWSTFPVLFPKMSMEFFVHGIITAILAFNTLFNFCVAAFSSAGPSPRIEWGKYELVGRKALEGYKFCGHCNLPKPPNAHHCRSCGACVVDMDHHCPFIGNCVGANNHQHFLLFLVFTAASSFYVLVMTLFASLQVWPKLVKFHTGKLPLLHAGSGFHAVGDILNSLFLTTEIVASLRAFALVYLLIAALALLIGVGLLLQQQLQLLHSGQTYIDSLASEGWKSGGQKEDKSWANLRKLFGKTHPSLWLLPRINSRSETPPKKIHVR